MEAYHIKRWTTGTGKNKKKHSKKVVTHRAYHDYVIKSYQDSSDQLSTLLYFKNTDMFRLDMKKSFDYSPAFLLEFEPFK